MTTEELESYMKKFNVDKKTAIEMIIEDLKENYRNQDKKEREAYEETKQSIADRLGWANFKKELEIDNGRLINNPYKQ